MATHSSVLAWRISGMGEPDGLPSVGSRLKRLSSSHSKKALTNQDPYPATKLNVKHLQLQDNK